MPDCPEFTALVVGAGPAGAAFALRCTKAGIRVALVEASRSPRIQPGETLHPGVEPLFADLGVLDRVLDAGFQRHRGVWVEWNGPRTFQPYGEDTTGPWRGFQADRAKLDALLLDAAREAGVAVFQSCRADGLVYDDAGLIAGVETSRGPIHARWVIDASGRQAWLPRQLGLESEHHSPSLRVRFGWTSGRKDQVDDEPSLQAHPCGWNWHAPLGTGRCAWVDLRIPSICDAATTDGSAAAMQHASGLEMGWRLLRECAGPGYFILGDAAVSLDPSSSHGVLRALMSGMLASHLLEGMSRALLTPIAAAVAYRDWMLGQFMHDALALRRLWQRHPSAAVRRAMTKSSANQHASAEHSLATGK